MIDMTKDKHHELQVRFVCTLGHITWQYDKEMYHMTWNINCHSWQMVYANDFITFLGFNT